MGVSRSFVESVVLLLLTAGLTGLLAPWVLKRVEERRLRRGKIIEAQSKLLDDLSALLWGWRYMTVKVTYYAVKGDAERYAAARKDYDEKVWEVFNDMRRHGVLPDAARTAPLHERPRPGNVCAPQERGADRRVARRSEADARAHPRGGDDAD